MLPDEAACEEIAGGHDGAEDSQKVAQEGGSGERIVLAGKEGASEDRAQDAQFEPA